MAKYKSNKVTLVGFGPGDPDLLTIAGFKALQNADIIYYDDLTNADYLKQFNAEKVYVGKRSGHHHAEQNQINQMLLNSAHEGKRTVRLKGGDPMIFAHGSEEIEFLENNHIETQIIPGVTAATASAAQLKVSLTQRGVSSSVAFINGHSEKALTPNADTLVYYMGGAHLEQIGKELILKGLSPDTPALLVHNASLPNCKIFKTTIGNLHNNYPTPLTAIIGNVGHQFFTTSEIS